MKVICLGCDKSHLEVKHMLYLKPESNEGICGNCVNICAGQIAKKEYHQRYGKKPNLILINTIKKGEAA